MFDTPDPSTLRQCSILASASFAFVFFVLWRGRRGQLWLAYWGSSATLYSVVLTAFQAAGDGAPTAVTVVLFCILSLTNALVLAGVRVLDGQQPFRPWMIAVVIATGLISSAPQWVPAAVAPVARGVVLSACLAANVILFAMPLLTSRVTDGSRTARRTAGAALIGYVPAYMLVIVATLISVGPMTWLTTAAMLSDQFLLPLLNLSLLAIPGLRSQKALRRAALRDPLTGAWNRAALAEREQALLLPGTVVMIVDIDHFKAINDRHGHALGDMVLIAIAASLERLADARGGCLMRMGGDEFMVVIPHSATPPESVAQAVHDAACCSLPGLPAFTVSVGVATVAPDDARLATVMSRADGLLYRAKGDGRGCIAA